MATRCATPVGPHEYVQGVCELNITKSISTKVKLLVFEQLACSLLVGKHQLRTWKCHLDYENDIILFPQKLQDDMTTPTVLKMIKGPNQDK